MKYNSTPRKLEKTYNTNKNNELELLRKTNKLSRKIHTHKLQAPKILFDSGWLDVTVQTEGNLFPDVDPNLFMVSNNADNTAKKGTLMPILMTYGLTVDLEIPENQLGLVKPIVMFEKPEDLELKGAFVTDGYYDYDSNEHYEIFGDSQKIYVGGAPQRSANLPSTNPGGIYSDEQDIDTALTSKWYRGDIEWESLLSGQEYRLDNAWVQEVVSYYNYTQFTYEGETSPWQYERFQVSAIDSLSSSSVTGTGSYLKIWYVGVGVQPNVTFTQNSSYEQNVTKTVPILGVNDTNITAHGRYYVDDVDMGLQARTSIHHGSPAGTHTYTTTKMDVSLAQGGTGGTHDLLRLWYSNLRAKEFDFRIDIDELGLMPEKDDYETDTLPYNNLTVDVNVGDEYPEVLHEYGTTQYVWIGDQNPFWTKVRDNVYRLFLYGTSYYWTPALEELSEDHPFIDETYSPSGDTYVKGADNREDKPMPIWTAEVPDMKYRIYIGLQLPYRHKSERDIKEERT